MDVGTVLAWLFGLAVLLPLASFVLILLFGRQLGRQAGHCATGAILGSTILSVAALLFVWLPNHWPPDAAAHGAHEAMAGSAEEHGGGSVQEPAHAVPAAGGGEHGAEHRAAEQTAAASHAAGARPAYSRHIYAVAEFGNLRVTISTYIDALTVAMMCMVSFVATCIHFYSMGYMHGELEEDYVDHEVTLEDGRHLHRRGRYARFFQYLSLFSFSMLGLVYSGNILMTFVFWELVGICSYFLIGFYYERHSASTAANKAFIVNRVGDFGMMIGLMALWGSLGTFSFGQDGGGPGIFQLVRPAEQAHALTVPEGMGYGLLIVAGLGIFCGCVGKSAQFPLHVWLPDAMEGPTPVSALVHSATMVAAGVFLVSRFYPVFAPEVLWAIAVIGSITLFLAASIAIVATDIKRVLAYSTVSQLGYMMLALGVGGWLAGTLHLFTHAFFKSLLFLCSGSVIHAVHTNDMTRMGGLLRKMPWTAYTMLVGCLAIAGAGIPFVVGLSGYYSKDAILEQALSFSLSTPGWGTVFFVVAAGGAAMTAFYMFRLWYLTFAGEPRDMHRYQHAHESPPVMYVPLVVLATLAVAVAWRPDQAVLGSIVALFLFAGLGWFARRGEPAVEHAASHGGQSGGHMSAKPLALAGKISIAILVVGLIASWVQLGGYPLANVTLTNLLEQARPEGTLVRQTGDLIAMVWPGEHESHAAQIKTPATIIAFSTALAGFVFATLFYGVRKLNPDEVKTAFRSVYSFLWHKWWFDELYDAVFVRPAHFVARASATIDKRVIDGFLHALAWAVRWFSWFWDRIPDRTIVDGLFNWLAERTYDLGIALRRVQTGYLRQYVMFIVVATVAIFVVASFIWTYALAR